MPNQIGGKTKEEELARLSGLATPGPAMPGDEIQSRLDKLTALMNEQNISCAFISAGTNLKYFAGINWGQSERLVGAIITNDGNIHYILPKFEYSTFEQRVIIDGEFHFWEEHESPNQLVNSLLSKLDLNGTFAVDEAMPYGMAVAIANACDGSNIIPSTSITAPLRFQKTDFEIASLQHAKSMTLEVHKSAARILTPGISTFEVTQFINEAHKAIGADAGSYFCITLFGEATSHPHGVEGAQYLQEGDMVLIDTGCEINGYKSDITRSYVYGEATERQTEVWNAEKEAQVAAFNAAQLGTPCEDVDTAARRVLERHGYGPDYNLPGLPHRTGHGIGLDIHEGPYLVRGDKTPLAPGMCFSNEPMLVVPNEFGVRLEDHFYMTENGPKWFTEPSPSIDKPFHD